MRLISLEYSGLLGLGDGKIPLHPVLTVICGANGVGKSTLLTACRLCIDFENAATRSKSRHGSCKIELSLAVSNGNQHNFKLDTGIHTKPDDIEFPVYRIDAGEEWFRIKNLVRNEENWQEVLDAVDPRVLNPGDLNRLSYLTQKTYSECLVYEIEDFAGLPTFPYVEVKVNGTQYKFEEMGAGEGALFLMWWHFDRIQHPCVVLLEEPETHTTGHSQRALMDCLAEQCESRVCSIVTTHSTEIISHVPKECLRLFVRNGNNVDVTQSPNNSLLGMTLGVDVRAELLVLVEDRCARELGKEILRRYRPDVLSNVVFKDVGSNDVVCANGKVFPPVEFLNILCLLDGNERGNFDILDGVKRPVEFLPSNLAPEEFLWQYCESKKAQIAEALDSDAATVNAILASINGFDHHDWFCDLASRLGISYERLLAVLLRIIVSVEAEIAEACQELADGIALHVKSN
ncbi:ATP-dependent nuclease [Stieleria maiorica]|uniref:ATP-dependent nuclease n=1 Tax=Stieleria maiorica TaxID=2795974 RepID=UPI00142F2B6E|nr:ATP-binding protein [Stieleria maiorica]